MDQKTAPILDALARVERRPPTGFGAPAHHGGLAIPDGARRLLGKQVFQADVMTPKGLDDRTEGGHVVQRAHEIAAEAWGADFCRFVTGGSTQSLHTALAAVAAPGDTVLIAANAHKAEWSYALAAGLHAVAVPALIDTEWNIEHGVEPAALAAALDANPAAKAVVVVSPTYYGVTSDIAALADLCHDRGIPLIVDAAWGAAFAFCERLPPDPLTKGADLCVYSAHKTMGALAQGSVLVANKGVVDLQRLWMAFELFETTSPSVPIMASLDATRRDHALGGEQLWGRVLDLAADLRGRIARLKPLRVFGREDVPAGFGFDESKVLIDVSPLGVSGQAIDDWLVREHGLSVGLSDVGHLLVILSLGTSARDVRRLAGGLADLVKRLAADPTLLPPAPTVPSLATLPLPVVTDGPAALAGPAEPVRWEDAAGRVAAEMIAPAPPGVPRLLPGQRITAEHVAWLLAQREAGAFILDPVDPSGHVIRVAKEA